MNRAERSGTSERRSARLNRRSETLIPNFAGVNVDPRLRPIFQVEEELRFGTPEAEIEPAEVPILTPAAGPAEEPDRTEEAVEEEERLDQEEEDRSESVSEEGNMVGSTRLKYSKFKGDGRQDVDDWLCEFESIVLANQEDFAAQQRIFQGLLKGEALKWYQDVPADVRNNWDALTTLFVRTFREAGGEARALGRLSGMTMKHSESVRKYGQRVKALIQKLTTDIAPSVQVEWYVAGFPEAMGFHIRQSRPATLREAMEAAQHYEDSAQSIRNVSKRGSRSSKREQLKDIRRRRYSESSSSESRSDLDSSQSESSDSEPVRASSSRSGSKRHVPPKSSKADKGKGPVKVKEEKDDTKAVIKKMQESLEAIKVNLAENRNPRRAVPAFRANVWCSRCGEMGHYQSECTKSLGRRVNYVNQEGEVYYSVQEEDDEGDVQAVFQIPPN